MRTLLPTVAAMCLLTSCRLLTPASKPLASVRVYGFVGHPTNVPWHRGLTLEAAITAAGGIRPEIHSKDGDDLHGPIFILGPASAAADAGSHGMGSVPPTARRKQVARIPYHDYESRAEVRHRQMEEGESIAVSYIPF